MQQFCYIYNHSKNVYFHTKIISIEKILKLQQKPLYSKSYFVQIFFQENNEKEHIFFVTVSSSTNKMCPTEVC